MDRPKPTPVGRFAAVTFDAGNTLLEADPPPPVLYARVLSQLGRPVTAAQVGPVFAEVWADVQAATPSGRDRYGTVEGGERAWWGAFVREVLGRLDHDAPWQEALEELYVAFTKPEIWRLFPEVEATLDALRSRGLGLAIISNWDSRLPAILEALGLAGRVDVITVSSLEGVEKPAAEIFTRTVQRLGVTPDQVLHVGDSPRDDYRGAAGAGLVPVLVDREGLFSGDGMRTVGDLGGVLAYVGPAAGGEDPCSMP